MSAPDWIAVDWGTSNLRAWAMSADNTVLASAESDSGMAGLEPRAFEPALLSLIAPWLGTTPVEVLACGMVGARQGWIEAAYAPVPCAPLGAGLTTAPTSDPRVRVRIVPGLCQLDPPDVMRGEETQIAGFLRGQPDYAGLICLPGTHSKWVSLADGQVTGFQTCMTGEMFDLLANQSVLRHSAGAGWNDDAFLSGVSDALARPASLSSSLFALRAASLVAEPDPDATRARLSGLLIGAELAGIDIAPDTPVSVVGTDRLATLYVAALESIGCPAQRPDAEELTLSGLCAVRALMTETLR